jgi:PAS domain S-box-containing protein
MIGGNAQLGDGALEQLAIGTVEVLMDKVPHATFSVKDDGLRYVAANRAMLELCGVRSRDELLGRTARDFFPEEGRQRYEVSDRLVMRTRRPILDHLDLTMRLRGSPIWVVLGKWPVIGPRQEVLGVAVLGRLLGAPDKRHPTYERMASAVEHIRANFSTPLDIEELAQLVGVSVSQFQRDFTGIFGIAPGRYITKVRLEAAIDLLTSDKPIAEIAQVCGYADQSAFTRRFHAVVGISPSQYRRATAGDRSSG